MSNSGVVLFIGAVVVSVLRKTIATSTSSSQSSPKLRLWTNKSCPYAARAWITLLEKGIECEFKTVDLQDKPADFNQLYSELNVDTTASSKVPILEDLTDGTKLIESAIIAQYIEDKYPSIGTGLMPPSPKEKAIIRLFTETFQGTLQMMPYKCLQTIPETRHELVSSLHKGMLIVDKFLMKYGKSNGPFLLGNDFTFAEVMTGPFIQRLLPVAAHFCKVNIFAECEAAGCFRLLAWMKAVLSRKSLLAAKIPDDALVAAYEAAKKRLADQAKAK
jgi:glutathione S-transferase